MPRTMTVMLTVSTSYRVIVPDDADEVDLERLVFDAPRDGALLAETRFLHAYGDADGARLYPID